MTADRGGFCRPAVTEGVKSDHWLSQGADGKGT